jgi:acetyl-CoA acetyltransferase
MFRTIKYVFKSLFLQSSIICINVIEVPANRVQEVYMGNVLQAGVGQAPARQAVIYAGETNLYETRNDLY